MNTEQKRFGTLASPSECTQKNITNYYYNIGNNVHYITETSSNIIKIPKTDFFTDKVPGNKYKILPDYRFNLDGLLEFKTDFDRWCVEIKSVSDDINYKSYKIDYKEYLTDRHACYLTFRRFEAASRNTLKKRNLPYPPLYNEDVSEYDNISYEEFWFFENCNNGGLIKLNPQYEGKIVESYGYDMKQYYPYCMSVTDFKFPFKHGKLLNLNSLKLKNLKYGIYKVKIQCENQEFLNKFTLNKYNLYTHYDLQTIRKYKKLYDIQLELVVDDEYNALVYEDEDLVDGKTIFGSWNSKLFHLKQKFPKNKLIKKMYSRLWGYLIEFERIIFTEEEYDKLDDTDEYVLITTSFDENGNIYYICVDTSKPYKHPYARIKSFLTSYARNIISNIITDEKLDDYLIRTHTDNITLTRPLDLSKRTALYYTKNLSSEDKTTGNILWLNSNLHYHKCSICNDLYNSHTGKLKDRMINHECERGKF